MSSHTWYVGTVNFVIWNSWNIWPFFDLWPLTGRSDSGVTVDNFACLVILDMLALLILPFEIHGKFDLFWPLTPYRKVGWWGHRGHFCMSSHTWYIGTVTFAIWSSWYWGDPTVTPRWPLGLIHILTFVATHPRMLVTKFGWNRMKDVGGVANC